MIKMIFKNLTVFIFGISLLSAAAIAGQVEQTAEIYKIYHSYQAKNKLTNTSSKTARHDIQSLMDKLDKNQTKEPIYPSIKGRSGNATISGNITSEDFNAVTGYEVRLIKVENDEYFELKRVNTDDLGHYNFTSIEPGTYVLFFNNQSSNEDFLKYLWKPDEVGGPVLCSSCAKQLDSQFIISFAELKTVNMTVQKGGSISGYINDGITNNPITGEISMKVYSHNGYVISQVGVDQGEYHIKGIPDGVYKLYFYSNFYKPQIYHAGECNNCIEQIFDGVGEDLIISNFNNLTDKNFNVFTGSIIQGKILDSQSLTPDYEIGLIRLYSESGVYINGAFNSGSQSDGQYLIGGLLPGKYYVVADTYIYSSHVREIFANKPCYYSGCDYTSGDVIEIENLEIIDGIDFYLDKGGTISGRVIDDQTGNATHSDNNLYVQAFNSEGKVMGGSFVGENGYYRSTTGIPAGEYSIKIGNIFSGLSSKPYIEQKYDGVECIGITCDLTQAHITVEVDLDTANLNFSLTKGSAISGIITDKDTAEGIGNVNLILYKKVENNALKFASFIRTSAFNLDENGNPSVIGSYQFSGLPIGEYYLVTNNGANLPFKSKSQRIHGQWIDALYGGYQCPAGTCEFALGEKIMINTQNADIQNVNIELSKGAIISGRALDYLNEPIGGITMQLFNHLGELIGKFNTDYKGEYATTGLTDGVYYLLYNSNEFWKNAAYGDKICHQTCDPMQSLPVTVINQTDASDINIQLYQANEFIFQSSFE